MTTPEAAHRANSILAKPQDKAVVLVRDYATDDDDPQFRAWIEGDYEEVEATEAEMHSMGGGLAIIIGLSLGLLAVAILTAIKFWPVIRGIFA